MRKCFALALLAAFSWIGGLGQDARADVTIDVVFQDGTGGALTITEGDAGPGCSFGGYYGGSVATGRCMDVILRTIWPGTYASTSVAYESDDGLALAAMYEWKGVGVAFNKAGTATKNCAPTGGLSDDSGIIQSFDCFIPPPVNPPVLPAGTYRVGTIVWDTSVTTPGTETIAAYIDDLADGFGAVINGDLCIPECGEITVNTAVLNIIPEAVGVPSMSATGTTLLGVAVFGIGILGLVIAARRRLS
jgi:hypothetical protein